jgi:hypothetical protein
MKPVSQFGHDLLLVCTQLLKKESTFILQLLVIFMLSASLIPTVRLALRTLESPQGTARTFWLEKGQILTMRPQAAPAPKAVLPEVKVAAAPAPTKVAAPVFKKYLPQPLKSTRVKYVGAQAIQPRSATKVVVPTPNRPIQMAARPAFKNADPIQQVRKTLKETYKVTQVPSYDASMQWARKTLEAYRKNT